jgi:hypothetical protein
MLLMTITTSEPDAARMAIAYGEKLQLGRDATDREIKDAIVSSIVEIVREYEKNLAIQSAVILASDSVTPITPTY